MLSGQSPSPLVTSATTPADGHHHHPPIFPHHISFLPLSSCSPFFLHFLSWSNTNTNTQTQPQQQQRTVLLSGPDPNRLGFSDDQHYRKWSMQRLEGTTRGGDEWRIPFGLSSFFFILTFNFLYCFSIYTLLNTASIWSISFSFSGLSLLKMKPISSCFF